jgi:hypothetical protein
MASATFNPSTKGDEALEKTKEAGAEALDKAKEVGAETFGKVKEAGAQVLGKAKEAAESVGDMAVETAARPIGPGEFPGASFRRGARPATAQRIGASSNAVEPMRWVLPAPGSVRFCTSDLYGGISHEHYQRKNEPNEERRTERPKG